MTFEQYYEFTVKMFRSMATGLFIYPMFVAVSASFDLNVHHYMPADKVMRLGMAFLFMSLVFFPLSGVVESVLTRKRMSANRLGKKMFTAAIVSMGLSELITIAGLIVFIVSGDVRYFYLYFALSFAHLMLNRPKKAAWQKKLNDRAGG